VKDVGREMSFNEELFLSYQDARPVVTVQCNSLCSKTCSPLQFRGTRGERGTDWDTSVLGLCCHFNRRY